IAAAMAGMSRATRMPMIRMTTNSSTRVKPNRRRGLGRVIGPVSGCENEYGVGIVIVTNVRSQTGDRDFQIGQPGSVKANDFPDPRGPDASPSRRRGGPLRRRPGLRSGPAALHAGAAGP